MNIKPTFCAAGFTQLECQRLWWECWLCCMVTPLSSGISLWNSSESCWVEWPGVVDALSLLILMVRVHECHIFWLCYVGEFCVTVRDKCLTHSCANGASCYFDSREPESDYRCLCAAGYTGLLCEQELNECNSTPCENEGTCTDLLASFSCQCMAGWTGARCERDVLECSSNPCQNGGELGHCRNE